jgi:hypothetical protein
MATRVLRVTVDGNALRWLVIGACAVGAGAWLRLRGIADQVVIDDEWHALHKLMRSDLVDILTHLDYADYSIPLTVYFRWLQDTVGITEWTMRLPMLVAGIALIAAAPLAARAWSPAPARALWAVLLAFSPLLVYLSRTARPYALTALLATLSLVAFERWYRGDRHRDAWGGLYVVATFAGGWLHMTSLAFTLLPFVYFGARALRAGSAPLRGLLRLGFATAVPLAIVLLPPVINDWFMFTAKAGVDSVTPESVYRTGLMLAGSMHPALALVAAVAAFAGLARIAHRDRELAGYLLTVIGIGTLAIVASRANWIQHPPVLARYLVPVLPLLLLLVAEGLLAWVPARLAGWRPAIVAAIAVAIWTFGPLPAHLPLPNQFTGHLRYQFDYDDAHNPYVVKAPPDAPHAFYRELAKAPPGSMTLVEAPWRLESHHNPHVWYQPVHRQNVRIGMTSPVCGAGKFGEYPEGLSGFALRNFVHLAAILRGEHGDADFLVMHRKPWSTPPEAKVPWPDVATCLPVIEAALGPPFFSDDVIVVWALGDGASARSARPH